MCVLCSVLVRAEVWPELNGRGGLCEIVQYNASIYFVNGVCINKRLYSYSTWYTSINTDNFKTSRVCPPTPSISI